MNPPTKLLRQLHLWLGLAAGAVLTLVGLSGAGLAFREEIDHALAPGLFAVAAPEAITGPDRVMATLRAAGHPERPTRLRFPRTPTATWEVALAGGKQVFVAPGGGRVVGERRAAEAPMAVLLRFHETLLAGEAGGWTVALATLAMLYLVGSGAWMGWRRVRSAGLRIRARFGWRVLVLDGHGVAGFVAAIFLTISALTGAAFAFSGPAMALLGARHPEPRTAGPAPGVGNIDAMLAAARNRFPAGEPVMIRVPKAPDAAWRFDLKQPGEVHPNGRTIAWLDPGTAAVLDAREPATANAGWRVYHTLNYPLHTGTLGGWPHRLVMPLVGLMPGLLFATGLAIRLGKRRRRPTAARQA